MQWQSVLSESVDTDRAVAEAVEQLQKQRGEGPADLMLVFASAEHRADYGELARSLLARLPAKQLIGCSGGGIIAAGREREQRPALAVATATLPEVELVTCHLEDHSLPADRDHWHERLGCSDADEPSFVLLADPFSFDVQRCLASLDAAFPSSVKVGGVASGARSPGGNIVFVGHAAHSRGAVLLTLRGNVVLDPIIAQGCRPIGEPMLVTDCDGHRIFGLGGRIPGEIVRELHDSLDTHDRNLFRHSLFLGIEMRDQREYRPGDFLIRDIVGLDGDSGMLAVAAAVRPWQAVQFHLRDARASSEDLDQQLSRYAAAARDTAPAAALLFSCLGRGEQLYGSSGHDSGLYRERVADVPVTGLFCNGEIGPVSRRTFLHGYTSVFAVVRPRH